MERGKYQSLTMINWNGFFARTFDIDNLVTTLSGGNGAGKFYHNGSVYHDIDSRPKPPSLS